MATIVYDYTIIDADWFDAVPTMANFNRVKGEINGQLDGNNFDNAMTPTVDELKTSEEISGSLIEPGDSLSLKASQDKDILFRLESAPTTKYLRIDESGVTIGA